VTRSRPVGRARVVVAALAMALLALALVVALVTVSRSPSRPTASAAPVARGDGDALRVLRAWDGRRAAAYAGGSARRLRDLYLPGSATGAVDVRLLEGYRARGLRVAGMRTQLLGVAVLERRPDRWTLRVTDRLAGAVAVDAGRRLRLPRDASSTRVVTMMRGGDGRWRVSTVVDAPALR
jgi:hypothetical protein